MPGNLVAETTRAGRSGFYRTSTSSYPQLRIRASARRLGEIFNEIR